MRTADHYNIALLQSSNEIPSQSDLPGNRNLLDAPMDEWLLAALDAETEEDAKAQLLNITAVYLWRNVGVLSWAKAVAMARESIWWLAFARDVKHGSAFMAKTEPEDGKDAHTRFAWKIENTRWRDKVFALYGAKVVIQENTSKPEKPSVKMQAISARLHRRTGSRQSVQEANHEVMQGSLF